MADNAQAADIKWYAPEKRGQLSIPNLHIPRSLRKVVKQRPYRVTINTAFHDIITACAAPGPERTETWINPAIIDVFDALHTAGHAHSVECWDGDALVGGLYGLTIGRVFCGESMMSRASNASKIALVHLVARLHATGFDILDTQFTNDHLQQFGAYEMPHDDYVAALTQSLSSPADFTATTKTRDQILAEYLKINT